MRTLLAILMTLTLTFSSASFAGQTTFSWNGQDNGISNMTVHELEQGLNSPPIKNQISQQLKLSASELGEIKIKSIEVIETSSGQYMTNIQMHPAQETFFCWLTNGVVANWIIDNNIAPNTNIQQFSNMWLTKINCLHRYFIIF